MQLPVAQFRGAASRLNHNVDRRKVDTLNPKAFSNYALQPVSLNRKPCETLRYGEAQSGRLLIVRTDQQRETRGMYTLRSSEHLSILRRFTQTKFRWEFVLGIRPNCVSTSQSRSSHTLRIVRKIRIFRASSGPCPSHAWLESLCVHCALRCGLEIRGCVSA